MIAVVATRLVAVRVAVENVRSASSASSPPVDAKGTRPAVRPETVADAQTSASTVASSSVMSSIDRSRPTKSGASSSPSVASTPTLAPRARIGSAGRVTPETSMPSSACTVHP
ncbi:MAG: hypothetical protein IT374_26365 [Polyangiaceae bacterium]|nr:hypothetical protein [Polyangiaceae bacterium]